MPVPPRAARRGVAVPPSIAQRGVYYLPWFGTDGEIFLAAVDRHGRRVYDAVVRRDEDPEFTEAWLWHRLDEEDPDPPLRLIG